MCVREEKGHILGGDFTLKVKGCPSHLGGSDQQIMLPPSAPEATELPSGDQRTQLTELSWPDSVKRKRGASDSPSTSHTCARNHRRAQNA